MHSVIFGTDLLTQAFRFGKRSVKILKIALLLQCFV